MLARADVDVVVLEQYPDFERLPQQRTTSTSVVTDEGTFTLDDFTRLPGNFQALSMVPQWDFLTDAYGAMLVIRPKREEKR